MKLTDSEKHEILKLLENDKPLPASQIAQAVFVFDTTNNK